MLACLPMSWVNAKYPEAEGFGLHRPAHEALSTNDKSSVVDLSLPSITVESEGSYPDSTQDNSRRQTRDALSPPPVFVDSERQFSDGAMELTTRFGHFCMRSLPAYLQPGIGASAGLAARCVSY